MRWFIDLSRSPHRRQRGLTLLELVVVLFILTVLAGVALQSTEQIVEQSSYDATRATLDNVEHAVVGDPMGRAADGTTLVTGFVADIGRLPLAVGNDPATQLRELWENPAPLPPFAIAAPAGDSQVRVGGGWRGPYLRLGAGSDRLTDGWGRPFVLTLADDDALVVAGDPILIVRSLGVDNAPGGTDYASDAAVVFHRTGLPEDAVPARHHGTVTGAVYFDEPGDNPPADAGALILVRVYGPTNGVIGTIAQFAAAPTGGVMNYIFDEDANGNDDAIGIGPRVIRAYLLEATAVVPDRDAPLDTDPALTAVSPITRITVEPGGLVRDLVLQTPSTP